MSYATWTCRDSVITGGRCAQCGQARNAPRAQARLARRREHRRRGVRLSGVPV